MILQLADTYKLIQQKVFDLQKDDFRPVSDDAARDLTTMFNDVQVLKQIYNRKSFDIKSTDEPIGSLEPIKTTDAPIGSLEFNVGRDKTQLILTFTGDGKVTFRLQIDGIGESSGMLGVSSVDRGIVALMLNRVCEAQK